MEGLLRRRAALAVLATGATLLASCGPSGFAGGGVGEVEIRVAPYGVEGVPAEGALDGTLEVTLRSYLRLQTVPREVTSGAQPVVLDLASGADARVALRSMDGFFYDDIEVLFSSVSAQITDPDVEEPLDVTVDLGGDGTLRVDGDNTRVLVSQDRPVTVTVHLGIEDWITEESGGSVPEGAFEDEVGFTVQTP